MSCNNAKMQEQHNAVVGRLFSSPRGPRNKPLARLCLAIPPGLPPYVAKAFPRKGWVLLVGGRAAVLVLLGDQFFSANESHRLLSWCSGYHVAHVVTMTEEGVPIWYPGAPGWWTSRHWHWLRRRRRHAVTVGPWPVPTRPAACQEAASLLTSLQAGGRRQGQRARFPCL